MNGLGDPPNRADGPGGNGGGGHGQRRQKYVGLGCAYSEKMFRPRGD